MVFRFLMTFLPRLHSIVSAFLCWIHFNNKECSMNTPNPHSKHHKLISPPKFKEKLLTETCSNKPKQSIFKLRGENCFQLKYYFDDYIIFKDITTRQFGGTAKTTYRVCEEMEKWVLVLHSSNPAQSGDCVQPLITDWEVPVEPL